MEFDPQVIQRLRRIPGNSVCADCSAADPEWASINIGVLVCVYCSGAHRALGTHISQIRSLKLDNWTEDMITKMESSGNTKVNSSLQIFVPAFYPKIEEFPDSDALRKRFIKAKYEEKAFSAMKDEDEERRKFCPKEGFLMKQSKNDSNKWQKRWLVLSEGALAYYKSSDSSSPKGLIQLGNAAVFHMPSSGDLAVSSGPGQREFRFRSSSPDEIVDWLISLNASISENGRGSLVRRALGSTLESEMSEVADEAPPGSQELIKEAYRVLSEGLGTKQGWLAKRSAMGMGVNVWSKRYVVLIPEGVIYYFRSRYTIDNKWKDPMGGLSIVGATIEKDSQKPYGIAIRCPESQLILAAENDEDRDSWITALKSAADSHILPAN